MVEFLVVVFLILGSLFLIPYGISKMTASEITDSEFRDLFWSEAGWHGRRIVCTILCFLPLMIIFNRPGSIEGWVVIVAIVTYGYYEHLKLYKNVQIFDSKHTISLVGLVIFHLAINAIEYLAYIGDFVAMLATSISAILWGWFVNLKRCQIVAKLIQQPAPTIA